MTIETKIQPPPYSLAQRVRNALANRAAVEAHTVSGVVNQLSHFELPHEVLEVDVRFQLAWLECGAQVIEVPTHLAALYAATSITPSALAYFRWPWPAMVVTCSNSALGLTEVELDTTFGETSGNPGWISLSVYGTDGADDLTWKGPPERLLLDTFGDVDCDRRHRVGAKVALGCAIALTDRQTRAAAVRRARSRRFRSSRTNFLPITRYRLANAVRVDLRAHVADYVRTGGSSPLVRTVVRGHHKYQAWGTGRSQRKFIWVQPYVRGAEHQTAIVRSHVLRDAESSARTEPVGLSESPNSSTPTREGDQTP